MDLKLKVVSVRNLTPDIKRFELVNIDGSPLPAFEAGAHIDVHTGKNQWRSYSLANDPQETNRYVTGILREANGQGGSKWMHDSIHEGDIIEARGPLNDFPLDMSAKSHLLIAGGIGITPMLSMVNALLERGDPREVWLFYGVRNGAEQVMKAQLRALADRYSQFHLHVCYSDPRPGDLEGRDYQHRGRIDIALLRAF